MKWETGIPGRRLAKFLNLYKTIFPGNYFFGETRKAVRKEISLYSKYLFFYTLAKKEA